MAIFPAFTDTISVIPDNLYGVTPPKPTFLTVVLGNVDAFTVLIDNDNFPSSETLDAFCPTDFFDLLSGNLFIRPIEFNLGFVTSDFQVTALIWNTYDVDAEVDSIVQEDPFSGVALTDLLVTDIVGARNDRVITYDILGIGGSAIMDRFDFDFVDGITPLGSLFNTFEGFRGFAQLFEPLLAGYSQQRIFSSDVFRSENGTETRATLFNDPLPVRKVSMSVKVFRQQDIADLQSLITFAEEITILVPSWYDESSLTAPTDGVSSEIFLDLTDREYNIGQQVLILKSPIRGNKVRESFVSTIEIINPTSLVLGGTPPVGFSVGDIVLPTLVGTPDKSSGWEYRSEKRALFSLDFSELR